jgi:hypothetical protein
MIFITIIVFMIVLFAPIILVDYFMDKIDYTIGKYELDVGIVLYITAMITIAAIAQIIYWVIKH